MNFTAEFTERLAQRRRAKIGTMSDEAFEELRAAVAANPDAYVDDDSERAFKRLGEVLTKEDELRSEDEFLDDESFELARRKRIERLKAGCKDALEISPDCADAEAILALISSDDANDVYEAITAACEHYEQAHAEQLSAAAGEGRAMLDVFMQPYLRMLSARARWELNTTRYTKARQTCEKLIELDPSDTQGARYSLAVVLARLEDEEAFNALDARFARQGNAWSHIARALLMFKLDRIPAARRALRSFDNLCRGGAYALLRPVYVERYIPDRPIFEPGSFEEAVLAVHECDPVVMDTPDFLPWCLSQDEFAASAQGFARDNDLDW